MKGNSLKVEATIEVDSRDDILEGGDNTFNGCDVLLFKGEGGRSGRNGRCRCRGRRWAGDSICR